MTIARELGKFPHEVGRMPFSDARDLADDLGRVPPLHVALAAFAGFKTPEATEQMTMADVSRMKAEMEAING